MSAEKAPIQTDRNAALAAAAALVRSGAFHVPDEKTWAAWREPRC